MWPSCNIGVVTLFTVNKVIVVYNCFFVETGQAKSQQSDVILNAV